MRIVQLKKTWALIALVALAHLSQDLALAESEAALFQYKDTRVIAQGKVVYKDHCASCHGDDLEGEENWRQRKANGRLPAPPHDVTGHTWHHPEQALFDLTKFGLAKLLNNNTIETDMPAYEEVLTDQEILSVLSFIKSTWPAEIQRKHDKISARQH